MDFNYRYLAYIMFFSLVFLLSGCVTADYSSGYGIQTVNTRQLQNEVTFKADSFTNSIGFIGIEGAHDTYLGLPQSYVLLSSLNTETLRVHHELFLHHSYEAYDWIFYGSARNQDAESLEFTVDYRDVSCGRIVNQCDYTEQVAATIPDEYLKKHRKTGFEVKFYGKTNTKVIRVTPRQISAQLAAIERQIGILTGTIEVLGYMPVNKVNPIYPSKAAQFGIEGFVQLRFDINENGTTTNIRVIKSSPSGVFDEAAMKAVKSYVYETNQYVSNLGVRIIFELVK